MDADSAAAFERLTKRLDYPMVVLTVAADGETSGCLVGFSTQCSINPPRYLVCLSVKNHTHALASRAPTAAVHFLGAEPHGLAALFGALTGDDVDKLARVPWRPGPGGAPLLDDVPNWFAGEVVARHDLGDHTGLVIEVTACASDEDPQPQLTFQQVKDMDPGHDP